MRWRWTARVAGVDVGATALSMWRSRGGRGLVSRVVVAHAAALVVGCGAAVGAPPGEERPGVSERSNGPSVAIDEPVVANDVASEDQDALAEPMSPSAVEMAPLEVEGFEPSVVDVPAGDGPWPLVVITHGAGGTPEHHCARYRTLVRGRAALLCTRGYAMNRQLPPEQRGYFYDGHHELGREVIAAMQALRDAFAGRIDPSEAIFAGYSQGASMGALFLHGTGRGLFRSALLVEGGSDAWNIPLSHAFGAQGGAQVRFVCGQSSCAAGAERSVRYLREAGLDAALLHAPGGGHTYLGQVGPLVAEALEALVAGDDRWGPGS